MEILKRIADALQQGDDQQVGTLTAEVTAKGEAGEVTLAFDRQGEALVEALEAEGAMPLPPYIRRDDEPGDRQRYQTVFARERGSVAAPTAGLHFDEALLAAIAARGVEFRTLTLHVGAGTFAPLRPRQLKTGRLHAERLEALALEEAHEIVADGAGREQIHVEGRARGAVSEQGQPSDESVGFAAALEERANEVEHASHVHGTASLRDRSRLH